MPGKYVLTVQLPAPGHPMGRRTQLFYRDFSDAIDARDEILASLRISYEELSDPAARQETEDKGEGS